MNVYEDRVTTKAEYQKYISGVKDTGIHRIWVKLLSDFQPRLKREAIDKGFILKKINDHELDLINLLIEIPDASLELQLELSNNHPFIICE